jgi:MerR family transcriptional regulator, thiopeptide resistance regulator
MKKPALYTVGELAEKSGVSVRTLHHYDEIGLLKPVDRTRAGYRLYDIDSVLRLQQILINRALGLNLDNIRQLLDDPEFDVQQSLNAQLEQLEKQQMQTSAMICAVKVAIEHFQSDRKEAEMDLRKIFDGFDPAEFDEEADARWGMSEPYTASRERTKSYTENDWRQIKDEQSAIFQAAANLHTQGSSPGSLEVAEVLERHRLFIDRWFYPCPVEFQSNLADMWESDPRFTASIDQYGEGLTRFLVEAVRTRAANRE